MIEPPPLGVFLELLKAEAKAYDVELQAAGVLQLAIHSYLEGSGSPDHVYEASFLLSEARTRRMEIEFFAGETLGLPNADN